MSPFGNRGAADFARALDSGTAGSLPGLALAARLRAAGASLDDAVAPRPEFRDALRMRLLAVATVQATAPAPVAAAPAATLASAVSWRRRTAPLAAGAMASVVAVSGVAVAGSQSLPGDPLYGVKRTLEAFQLSTADGAVEKGTQHLELAATRLREVRGLTLGRDAAKGGPDLGPAALGGTALRSSFQSLGSGEARSAGVADRVRSTLVEMDEQTREGSELLTAAYRSSREPAPLRALNRFATRQSAGLEELLPVLPARTQSRARASLALLDDVTESTGVLLAIGTCAEGCDPSTAAPTLPVAPGAAPTSPAASEPPCACAAPEPAPAPAPSPTAPQEQAPAPQESEQPEPEPTRTPSPEPSAEPTPSPSPSPSSGLPLPPLPVPLPPLPVPVPTLTLAPLAPALDAAAPANVNSRTQDAPGSSPLPQLAPAPTRP